MKALEQFKDKKQKLLNEQIERQNAEQLQVDMIAEQEYRWAEERVWNEDGEYEK